MTALARSAAVLVERRGHVMIVTINRPEARNAVNEAVWRGAGAALAAAYGDAEVRAVIITGAGEQSFCAGADLKALSRGERIAPAEPEKVAWGFAGIVSHAISKPLIAAVNETALGGGTEIALACDLVVAVDSASFGLPEVKRGILAGAGGVFRLVQQLPRKVAMEMLLTGDPIDAARARLGAGQRSGAAQRVARRRNDADGANRGQCASLGAGEQADRARPCRRQDHERGRGLGADPHRSRHAHALRGCARGPESVCRKARTGMAGTLRHRQQMRASAR